MTTANSLNDMYNEELQDLWSANEQMSEVVREMAGSISDDRLSGLLLESASGIQTHTRMIKDLLEESGGQLKQTRCRGMEGLVEEARSHAIDGDMKESLQDLEVIAQYQRMCHYGLAGFGTARAYAEALGRSDHAEKLDEALAKIYRSDQYMTEFAERLERSQAS